MNSIRNFLIIVLLAAVTLINFLAALHGYRASLAASHELFDQELSQLAAIMAAHPPDPQEQQPATNPKQDMAYQVWRDGSLLIRSSNAPIEAIAPFTAGFHETNFGRYRWRTLVQPEADGRWIMFAERMDRRFQLAEKVIIQSVLPIVACLPLIGLIIWLVVGRGLQPLQQLARQLREKRPEDLRPLDQGAQTIELQQLVTSVNDLLRRLAAAFEREQRFAAHAAHELRTPLSILKVHLYNLQQQVGRNATMDQLNEGLDRLGHLVEQILALHVNARDRSASAREPVDLVALCQQVISEYYPGIELKEQEVELRADKTVFLDGYPLAIETLIANLLINASKYSPKGAHIIVSVSNEATGPVMTFEDSGPGIPNTERERVFERFYRVGGDRHDSGESGCGLGLAVVRQIVDTHGGTIQLSDSAELGGLKVELRFGPTATRS